MTRYQVPREETSINFTMDLLQMDCLRGPFFDHDDHHRHLAVRILMTTSKWLDNNDYVIM